MNHPLHNSFAWTKLTLLAILLSISFALVAQAECFGSGGSCGINLDLSGAVDLQANPAEIAPGESSNLTFTLFMADNCVADFPFTMSWVAHDATQYCYDNGGTFEMCNVYTGSGTVSPTETTTYTVTCRDVFSEYESAIQYVSDSVTVTVRSTTGVDLTAGAITQDSIPSGIPTDLTTIVTNTGVTSTGVGFPTLFQWAAAEMDIYANDLGTYTYPTALAGSGNFTATYSYTSPLVTTPTDGLLYFRACADKSSMGDVAGVIDESLEENNCGPWKQITLLRGQCLDGLDNDNDGVVDTADADCSGTTDPTEQGTSSPTVTLTATPTSVVSGNSSTLTWESTGTSCTGTGFATGGLADNAVGVSTGPLSANTNYSISCTGPGGTGTDTASVSVSNPTVSLTAAKDRVVDGGSTTLSWDGDQVTACTLTGTNGLSYTAGMDATAVPSGAITTQTTFTVSCDSGAATDKAIVNVNVDIDEF